MIQNNNLSVLPFYQSIEEQNHRRSYAYGQIYPLYTQVGVIPPFQITVPYNSETFSSASLFKADGTLVTSGAMSALVNGGLTKDSFQSEGYSVIVYPGFAEAGLPTEEGQYYLTIALSGGTVLYSDIFTAVGDVSPYVMVEWYDREDLVMDGCRIIYDVSGQQFKNRVYLNTEIGKPDYEFEEEGETRDGLFFPEKMISEKTYKMTFLASEYLCDVMRFVRMADVVRVTDRYGRQYVCDTFLMTPKWETQGDVASVEAEFQTNTVAKRIGRSFI